MFVLNLLCGSVYAHCVPCAVYHLQVLTVWMCCQTPPFKLHSLPQQHPLTVPHGQ